MTLEKYLSAEVMRLALASKDRDGAIRELIGVLTPAHGLCAPDHIYNTVLAREAERSTAMGRGVAIPHARLAGVDGISLALGRSAEGIAWGAPDGRSVNFIFMIVGPAKASQEYLRLLADISRLMMRAAVRKALLVAQDGAAALKIIAETKVRARRT